MLLGAAAQRCETIAYADVVSGVRAIRLTPRTPALFELLRDVSIAVAGAGRGMASAPRRRRRTTMKDLTIKDLVESLRLQAADWDPPVSIELQGWYGELMVDVLPRVGTPMRFKVSTEAGVEQLVAWCDGYRAGLASLHGSR